MARHQDITTPIQAAMVAEQNEKSSVHTSWNAIIAAAAKALLKERPNWPPKLRYHDYDRPSATCTCTDDCDIDSCVNECTCNTCVTKTVELAPWRLWERPGQMHSVFESVYMNGSGPYSVTQGHCLDYESCRPDELKRMVINRGLPDPYPAGLTIKALYVKLLSDADRKAKFRFLDLPPEMRNLVYAELLIFNTDTCPHHRFCYAQILRTCRLIYSEAKDILYEDNTIDVRFGAWIMEKEDRTFPTYTLETDATVHKEVTILAGKTDHGRIPSGISAYPDFLKRVTKMRLSLAFYDESDDATTYFDNGIQYLRNCVLTLASFLMDEHRLRLMEIDIRGMDALDDDLLTIALRPLRRLRGLRSVNIIGGCPIELAAGIKEDMQSIGATMNTLKHAQLLMGEAHAVQSLNQNLNPLQGYCDDARPQYRGEDMVDIVTHHFVWINLQLNDMEDGYGLFETDKKEKKLQIRLAKMQNALADLNINALRKKLQLLKAAKEAKTST